MYCRSHHKLCRPQPNFTSATRHLEGLLLSVGPVIQDDRDQAEEKDDKGRRVADLARVTGHEVGGKRVEDLHNSKIMVTTFIPIVAWRFNYVGIPIMCCSPERFLIGPLPASYIFFSVFSIECAVNGNRRLKVVYDYQDIQHLTYLLL